MPRAKVYGKKSRGVVACQLDGFSSPEQKCRVTATAAQLAGTIKSCKKTVSKWQETTSDVDVDSRRRVLGERDANTVAVAPRKAKVEKQLKELKSSASSARHTSRRREDLDDEQNYGIEKSHPSVITKIVDGLPTPALSTLTPEISKQRSKGIRSTPSKEQIVRAEQNNLQQSQRELATEDLHSRSSTNVSKDYPRLSDASRQHCSSVLSLSLSADSSFSTFEDWNTEIIENFRVSKIAEASFGEVYRLCLLSDLPAFTRTDESVFKIIALKSPPDSRPKDKKKRKAFLKGEEYMSSPDDVVNEIRLLQRMSCIPGFTNFRDVRILQGRPTGAFVDAFHVFDADQKAQGKDGSHFPDPASEKSYAVNQLWAVIEMQDAGTDLERLVETAQCTSIWTTWDIFWRSTIALAKGEQGAGFEHRDLHLGNICVHNVPPPAEHTSFLDVDIDPKKNLGFTAVDITIIDYTLSRADLWSSNDDQDSFEAGRNDTGGTAYKDLSLDPSLFQADSTYEYQYDIYRYMRGVLFADDAYHDFESQGQDPSRDWSQYHPQTNLVWIHFILYKLLEQVSWPSAVRAPPRGKGRKRTGTVEQQRYAKWKRGNELEVNLLQLQELLDPGQICANGIGSAGDLVALAMNEGWLDIADVIGDTSEYEQDDEYDDLADDLRLMSLAGQAGTKT